MESVHKHIRPVVKQNEMSPKNHYLLSALQSFELTINDKKRKYFDKIQSLVVAWDQLTVYISVAWSKSSPIIEVESLLAHTLRIVLRGDWPKASAATQTHLTVTLHRFISVLNHSKRYPYILQQCRVLEDIVKNPWTHPVLGRIFAGETVDIDDLVGYFTYENGRIVVLRLEMMLESKCEDIALRLARSCLLMYNNSHPMELDFNQNELDYITDIYYCTLFRNQNTGDLINEIKVYDLEDGLQLLKRYNRNGGVGIKFNDNCKDARVWKCSCRVVELVANTLLANSVLHDCLVDTDTILPDLIAEWAIVQKLKDGADIPPNSLEMIRKLVISAASSKCIYPFCSFLINHCASRDRYLNLVSTCLIRAITWNINDIEKHRVDRDYDSLKATYEQLSQGFVLVSKLFADQKNIFRECLLTSFSLTPSREGLLELASFVENAVAEEPSPPADTVSNQNTISSCPEIVSGDDQHAVNPSENVANDNQDSNPKETDLCAPSDESSIQKASNSPEKVPELDASETVRDNTDGKPVTEPVAPLEEATIATDDDEKAIAPDGVNLEVPKIEPDFEPTSAQVIPPGGNLLSLVTDTKLKSGGALEELVKGSAPDYCTEVEKLKLEESTKTDLNFILRYQRFRSLSWELDWNELKENCENFLEVFEKRGFEDVELKYLDIDYNQFKNKPINEEDYIGIEKGYEHFALPDVSYEDSDVVQYSSGFSDEEFTLRPRKKSMNRNKLRRTQAKSKFYYDGESDEEFVNSPGNMFVSRKKRKGSIDSSDSDYRTCKKRVKRAKARSETDSQSENYPPDNTNEVDDESLCRTNVQLLRQFRIGAKASGGGELSEIACNDARPSYRKQDMKFVPSKCDKRAGKEKLVKPRMSVTSPVPGKRSTMQQIHAERGRRSSVSDSYDSDDSLGGYSVQLEVKLHRCDAPVGHVANEDERPPQTELDSELQALLASFDPSQPENTVAVTTETMPRPEPELEVKPEAKPVLAEIDPPKTEEEAVEEVKLAPLTQPIVAKKKYRRTKPKDGEPRRPRGRPKKNVDALEMSSSSAQQYSPLPQYGLTIDAYSSGSYLEPTPYTPISYSADASVASTPAANCVSNFLNNVPNDWGVSWDQNYTQLFATPAATSCNYVEPGMNSYPDTHVPTTGHVHSEVNGLTNSAVFTNADGYYPNYAGAGYSTANVEHTPAAFANYDAIASSSSTVNAPQSTPPMYTNLNASSSSTPNYMHSPIAMNDMAVQTPAEFASPQNGVGPVQTTQEVVYSQLVHPFADAQSVPLPVQPPYTGMKRQRKKKNLEFPGPSAATSYLANGQLPVETKKRPRNPKNVVLGDDGQPVKVKRPRKPKAEPNQNFLASSMSVLNNPASSSCSAFNYDVSPPANFVQNSTHAYQQQTSAVPVADEHAVKVDESRNSHIEHGPVPFPSTSDYLPSVLSDSNANYSSPSVYGAANSYFPSQTAQSIVDLNDAASYGHFNAATGFQSTAGVPFAPQGPASDKPKAKRPRKPRKPNNELAVTAAQGQTDDCRQEQSLIERLAAAFTAQTPFSNDEISSMITSEHSDSRPLEARASPKAPKKRKNETTFSNGGPSTAPPRRRGRPPKPKPAMNESLSPSKPISKTSYLTSSIWSSASSGVVGRAPAMGAAKSEINEQEINSRLTSFEAMQRSMKLEVDALNAAGRDALNPVVLIPAMKIPPSSTVKVPPDTPQNDARSMNSNSNGQYSLASVQVRLPPFPSHQPCDNHPSTSASKRVKRVPSLNDLVSELKVELPSTLRPAPVTSKRVKKAPSLEDFVTELPTSTRPTAPAACQRMKKAPSLNDFLTELSVELTPATLPSPSPVRQEHLTGGGPGSSIKRGSLTGGGPPGGDISSPMSINASTPITLPDGWMVVGIPDPNSLVEQEHSTGDGSSDEISATLINATTPKTLSEGYAVVGIPDINTVSKEQLSPNQDQVVRQQQFGGGHVLEEDEHQYSRVYQELGGLGGGDASAVSCQHTSGSSHDFSSAAVNAENVTNIEEEYIMEVTNDDPDGPCISIPERALAVFSESYLPMNPYLSLLGNTDPNPPRDQTVSSNNDYIDLFNPYLLDQMTSYGQ